MTLRRCTAEHVFGTLKHWMGSTHFPNRTLAHVSAEMSLRVLALSPTQMILPGRGMTGSARMSATRTTVAPDAIASARPGNASASSTERRSGWRRSPLRPVEVI